MRRRNDFTLIELELWVVNISEVRHPAKTFPFTKESSRMETVYNTSLRT